uniref:Leucine-rich PPR motif-containing protein, mitochondrial n=1 Tax=Heterorhabditis bacteriophora TaxID=37862 RepID=A0A1I7XLT4_HETBA
MYCLLMTSGGQVWKRKWRIRIFLLNGIAEIFVSITALNERLSVLLENDSQWSVIQELKDIKKRKLVEPSQYTYELLLEKLAREGDLDNCKEIIRLLLQRGFVLSKECINSLIYCYTFRGQHNKADTLVKKSTEKYGPIAFAEAQGVCLRASAAKGDISQLCEVLRRATTNIEDDQSYISSDDMLETIWLLTENSHNGHDIKSMNLIEQILDQMRHEKGFFRKLIREVERHISHQHYLTAVTLLEDTNKVAEYIKNQRPSVYMQQMLGQLCRQLIRNKVDVTKVSDIANRINAIFRSRPEIYRIHDDILYAALMEKNYSQEQRMEFFFLFIDAVDKERQREHLILPLLTRSYFCITMNYLLV